jgi:very-short-patch-repair endonuclease
MNIEYMEEYSISIWSTDFYIPELNLYCEIDGDYFHSNPLIYPNGPVTKTQKINYSKDISKNKFFEKNNLHLIRFWESEILNNPEEIKCKLKKLQKLDM